MYLVETVEKFVAECLKALLELVRTPSLPVNLVSRDSIIASKGDVEDVLLSMAVVAVDICPVAPRRQRNGRLANNGGPVVSV